MGGNGWRDARRECRLWARLGGAAGLLTAAGYVVILPGWIPLWLGRWIFFSIPVLGILWAVGLHRRLGSVGGDQGAGSKALLDVGVLFAVAGGVLLTSMAVVQNSIVFYANQHRPDVSEEELAEVVSWTLGGLHSVHLGLDFTFDLFFLVAVIAFGIIMARRPFRHRLLGAFGVASAGLTLGLNVATFPVPPTPDLGPLVALWMVAVSAWMLWTPSPNRVVFGEEELARATSMDSSPVPRTVLSLLLLLAGLGAEAPLAATVCRGAPSDMGRCAGAFLGAQQDDTVDRAMAAFHAGRLADARSLLLQVDGEDPRHGTALFWLGRVAFAEHRWEDAEEHLEEAVERLPRDAEVRYWLGRAVHERMESASLLRKGLLARKAIRTFGEAVELDPSHVDARVWLANYLWEAPGIVGGDRDRAREEVGALARFDPVMAHRLLGTWAWGEDDHAGAAREYHAVLEAEPGDPEALYMLGRVAQEADEHSGAIRYFRTMLEAAPSSPTALYQLGRSAALGCVEIEDGLRALERYLELDPGAGHPAPASAHWRRGMLRECAGDMAGARTEYRSALQLDPDHERARAALDRITDGG